MTRPHLALLGSDATVPFSDGAALVVGRSRDADLPVHDPACSRRQFRVRRGDVGFVLEPLSENSPTFCDGARVTGPTPVRPGALIEAGASRFRVVAAADPAPPAAGAARETVRHAGPIEEAAHDFAPVRLGDADVVLGRDPGRATEVLAHPLVSRRHALVRRHAGGAVVKDLGSANGTFVNGKRLGVAVRIDPGDRLQVGPFALVFTGDALVPAASDRAAGSDPPGRLVAHRLRVVARAGRPLLDDVSLAFRAGEFVAVIGPTGCGKSTLLTTLSGAAPPAAGRVVFDGCDLYAAPAGATRRVAVVPQREVLPTVLPVAAALRYTAALRLPPDTTPAELDAAVAGALAQVGLADRAGHRIGVLSGGQVKRVGLANELIADPGLVLLDEVTSGLDEQADREMMGLFRHLATAGKTVVAVTHTLAHVPEFCHRVVVLAPGGRVAFVGRPADALEYFRIDRLGDVYERLREAESAAWAAQFAAALRAPRVPEPPPAAAAPAAAPADTLGAVWHQAPVLAARSAHVLAADPRALAVAAFQPVLVAALVVWAFGDVRAAGNPPATAAAARSVLFVLAVTAFWLGCNTAAREVVREWALHRKERQVNLSPAAYLLGKWAVLAGLTVAQVGVLYLLVAWGCALPGEARPALVLLAAVGAAGVSAGLLASAAASSEAFAVALVPVLVIPQLVLGDAFRPLSGGVKAFADAAVSAHRGFGGLLAALPPDLAAVVAPVGVTVGGATAAVLAQAGVLAVAAWAVLDYRGRASGLAVSELFRRLRGAAR